MVKKFSSISGLIVMFLDVEHEASGADVKCWIIDDAYWIINIAMTVLSLMLRIIIIIFQGKIVERRPFDIHFR